MSDKGERAKQNMSKTRKAYFARLNARIVILVAFVALYLMAPGEFRILRGMNFFEKFSVFHLLWGLWFVDMLYQLLPLKKEIALGSRKHFKAFFQPIQEKLNTESLRNYIVATTKAAYKVMLLWGGLIAALGVLYYTGVLNREMIFLLSIVFYVCDLICVLIWCPFRLIMKNKCCTTCRIFNWDHLMMFSPLIFLGGFYCISLLVLAVAVWLVWEICIYLHPERFWEQSNASLKCSECKDKLCTQYCQKLRK